MINQVDIVLVGASIVGLTFANAMTKFGGKILVVDGGQPISKPTDKPEMRVSAMSLASQRAFKRLSVWDKLAASRVTDYRAMHVWEQDSFAEIGFDADSVGTASLGTILENDNLVSALNEVAAQQHNIELRYGVTINSLDFNYPNHFIQLSDGTTVVTKLVVGADGGSSMVRQKAGFPTTFWSYDQQAIVATVSTEREHQKTARQAFTPSGPLAFLPIWSPHQCSIVWSQDNVEAERLLNLPDEDFEKALSVAFDLKLGKVKLESKRACFPLKMQYARQWVSDGVVIIGDAAHTIHPLAGQGANLGIMDALALAETLLEQDSNEQGFASARSLRGFERWRKAEAAKMIASMEGFKQLFSGGHPIKKLVRGLGMSAVDHLPVIKENIIEQALGSSGHLPKIASPM